MQSVFRPAPAVLLLALGAWGAGPAAQEDAAREGMEFFEKKIRPVLAERCYSCHSAQAGKVKGGLHIDTREGLLRGGHLGPAIVPGQPEKSVLLLAIKHADPDLKMPPKTKLPPEIVRDFETWIALGAPDPRHADAGAAAHKGAIDWEEGRRFWSFRPLADPPAPEVRDRSWPESPIDRFILAKLEEKGLRPAPDADRRTLLRRATFDLTGLPPTPEEMEAFLADDSPDAFAKVVERLLASPHYGERWGRHWLDVVRYADTAGDNSDFPIPQVYRYRNWVIRAFNEDKPYGDFIREQIAGDLLPWKTWEERCAKVVATGYLALARRFGSRVDDYPWHLTIEDTIDNLGRTFLGLTINCARCHDHKFDPISQEDYYGLYGILAGTRYPWPGIELQQYQRDLVPLAPPEVVETALRAREERRKALEDELKRLEAEKKAVDRAAAEAALPSDGEAARARERAEELGRAIGAVRRERDLLPKTPLPFETAYAVSEGSPVASVRVHLKGDPARPGAEVPRRFLTVFGARRVPDTEKGSGRLHLAEWLADPSNALAARVAANRIWTWHFGRGIVPTPSDFGKQGKPPTHPELLDWLARRFLEDGGSFKAMHRRILLSRTYRMSGDDVPANAAVDPANELFWRYPRRRLEAEAIRDAMLAVSGGLDRTPGGPHPFPPPTEWGFTQHKPFIAVYESPRRSVYLMTQRIRRHPFFGLFDGADPSASTAHRGTSTTPLQALWFFNDRFVHEQARLLAGRLRSETEDAETRLQRAYLLCFGRPPDSEERQAARGYLDEAARAFGGEAAAWESFARVLLRSSEFIYIR
ncbi:MAG: PSD1 and planctomycete cytochrome C domain-containing protein [Planctomycetota bacterium]